MNRLKYNYMFLLYMLLAVVGMSSCDTDYMDYDTGMKDAVYLTSDSLNFQFGMNKGEEYLYQIPVRLLGMPSDVDRHFSAVLVKDSTTAKEDLHYTLDTNFVIPAGSTIGYIKVNLYRYKDREMAEHPVVIRMQLQENDNFRVVIQDNCDFWFSDTELPRPRWWSENHFGPYSQMLMIDLLNYYWELEETHPLLYERIESMYGREFELALSFPYQQEVAIIKYMVTPAYEYYKEHPNDRVDIPDPSTLL